jgi:hypothetical protein
LILLPKEGINVRISVLPKTSLGRWSVGLVATIILIFILVPILEYQVGIELGPESVTRIILAAALGISSIGSIATGLIGVRGKRGSIYFLPLLLGLFALIVSVDMMFDTGA